MQFRHPIRDTKRLAEILGVVARFGFSAFVRDSGIEGLIARGRSLISRDEDAEAATTRLPQNVRIRMMLEELGPTFIKLGQVLSTRPDLIPSDLAEELRKLQADCPRVPFEEIRAELDREFAGRVDEIYESIDEEPLAAASIAQVHRAVLADGTPVVVKVLRPGIDSVLEADMVILRELARFAERHFKGHGFSPTLVVQEFSKQLSKEVRLTIEARSTDRLARQFADIPGVSFPRVYPDASTRRVLTLEEIHGQLLSRLDVSTLPPLQRHAIVEHGADAVFHMCLEVGFFHADPHPGNIFVHEDGSITFIDCGMTGYVDQETTAQVAQLVRSVVDGDVRRVIQVALELSDADPSLDFDRAFRSDVAEYVAGLSLEGGALEDLELGPMLQGFFDLLRRWEVVCPSDLVFLIKALATIEGVGQAVDPTFNLVSHVRPKLERKIRRQYAPPALSRRVLTSIAGYVDVIEDLPQELKALLAQARRNDFAIRLQHEGLDRLSDTVDKASRTVAYALMLSAVIVASSVLILADRESTSMGVLTIVGFIGLAGVAAVVLVLAAFNFLRWRRRK